MDKERLFGAAMKGAVQAKTTTNNDSAIIFSMSSTRSQESIWLLLVSLKVYHL